MSRFAFAFLFSSVIFLQPGWAFGGLDPEGNWTYTHALPGAVEWHGGWAASPNSFYVGGDGGVVMHWNGSTWDWMSTPTDRTVYAIHGSSEDNIWAVGGNSYSFDASDRGAVMRYNGTSWIQLTPPSDGADQEHVFVDVHVFSPSDVWCVPQLGTFLFHWNGAAWEEVYPSMDTEGSFHAIHGFSDGKIYVSGSHGQILSYVSGTWTLEQKTESGGFSTNLLTSLWGPDSNTVYAAGSWGQVYRRESDGTWTDLGFPTSINIDNTINHICGTSAGEIYFIGNHTVRHWDGETTPNDIPRDNRTGDFRSQWTGASEAGGTIYCYGRNGVVTSYVPTALGTGTLSNLTAGYEANINMRIKGSASCGEDGILIFGDVYNPTEQMPLIYFDGTLPQTFPVKPEGMATQTDINAVVSDGLDDIVLAWREQFTSGGVARWDGESWTTMRGQTGLYWPVDAVGMVKSSSGRIHAATAFTVVYWDGTEWILILNREDLTEEPFFTTIWARADNDVYVGTDSGLIYHYNGVSWTKENTPVDIEVPIKTIIGDGTRTYAFGEDGLAWRKNATWSQVPEIVARDGEYFVDAALADDSIVAIQNTNPMYTGGGKGRIWKFTGNVCTLELDEITDGLEVIASSASGQVFALNRADFLVRGGTDLTESLELVQIEPDVWTPLGDGGIEILTDREDLPPMAPSVFAVNRPARLLAVSEAERVPGSVQYLVLQDRSYQGSPLGPARLRVPAESGDSLYRLTGGSWAPVAANYRSGDGILETVGPVELGHFAIASGGTQPMGTAWIVTGP